MKQIQFRKAEGKRLSIVHDCDSGWRKYKTNVKVPDSSKLFNFDLEASDGKNVIKLLVLDPYGDESLDTAIRKRVGLGPVCGWPLAIDRTSGALLLTGFFKEKNQYGMTFFRFSGVTHGLKSDEYVVPKHYLSRLDELKSKKRPFDISAMPNALASFIDRSIGFNELSTNLVVRLDFDRLNIEVWGEAYREVSCWKDRHRTK